MAGNENSGGDRPDAAQSNFGVSAVGGNGSANGVPNIDYTGFAYSENQKINSQMDAAPLGTQPTAMPSLPEVTPITAPSSTPERPITYGMPFGDGAGSEVNPLPVNLQEEDESRQIIRAMYQQNPRNEDLRYLVETMDIQQQYQVQ
jgi:hypothetical protein